MTQKSEIRKEILRRLKNQKEDDRRKRSLLIKERLFHSQEFQSANTVMFYISKNYEVETEEMIKEALKMGKRVAVPFIPHSTGKNGTKEKRKMIASEIKDMDKGLEKGPYGINQPGVSFLRPIDKKKIDLVVVPGIAFDCQGRRLGHGAGYYDTFLKDVSQKTQLIGLAFDFQVLEALPVLSHDIPITKLLTA